MHIEDAISIYVYYISRDVYYFLSQHSLNSLSLSGSLYIDSGRSNDQLSGCISTGLVDLVVAATWTKAFYKYA
jgi:hypothetical protein